MKNRMPAVAGAFYPANEKSLSNQVSKHFENAVQTPKTKVVALIVPHAGYVYSGDVAASAYVKLDQEAKYQNIFLIGPSHHKYFNGVSIYPEACYVTPMGEVSINKDTAQKLTEKHKFVYYDPDADEEEHCLEVQLPFLQYRLSNEFQIIPLIVGSDNLNLCHQLSEALTPWFNDDNLFVISTDFSHYPKYESAVRFDAETADAIVSNEIELLRNCCNQRIHTFPSNTQTALCGSAAVQTLLGITQRNPKVSFEKILYKNSGDYAYGNKNRVVGYWAIAINRAV
jgi:MEMO1 family protein